MRSSAKSSAPLTEARIVATTLSEMGLDRGAAMEERGGWAPVLLRSRECDGDGLVDVVCRDVREREDRDSVTALRDCVRRCLADPHSDREAVRTFPKHGFFASSSLPTAGGLTAWLWALRKG